MYASAALASRSEDCPEIPARIPAMARKTKAEALATRNAILDAAERMFCTRGVARTSLHAIADRKGLTRGAVYWHFEGKYDLLEALWERCMLPLEEAFAAIDAELADDPLARIRAKGRRVFWRITHDARVRNFLLIVLLRCEMVDEIADARGRMLAAREECLGTMAKEFAHAVAAGQLPGSVDVDGAAIGLHAVVDGLAYHWLLDRRRFDLERTGARALDAYLCGLGAEAPAAKRRTRRPALTAS